MLEGFDLFKTQISTNTLILAEKQDFRNLGPISNKSLYIPLWIWIILTLEFFSHPTYCSLNFSLSLSFFSFGYFFLHSLAILREKYIIRFKYESRYTFICSNPRLIPNPWILELYLSILSTKQSQIGSTVKWLANMHMTLLYWMVYKYLNIQKSFLPELN